MGITARGAWECVKRHFREMDIDIQRQPFRVVGVGDMSGDVFGNGMLLSEQIRLVAAFDHRDIFIDPEPDAAAGFAERKRLFELPRSSWQDYDRAKISRGGGVFSRSAKAIPVSAEMQALLGLDAASVTPAELIRAVLKCKTDLLWFGGIGTYVRASGERDEDVGDRANDALRVAAAELEAKVVGEGANLGVTQRGAHRVRPARRAHQHRLHRQLGGRQHLRPGGQHQDRAAGGRAARGKLDAEARRKLLADMTGDVAAASLRNNYQQSLALSLAERRSARELPDYALLMRALEARGLLDRALEALPSEMELQERARAGRGLTRPELAVLLSYAKIALQHDLLAEPGARRAAARELAHRLLPAAPARALSRRDRRPQPAPRDRRARPHQRRRQPRRAGHGGAARRRDAAARPRRWRTPSWRCARSSTCRGCGSASMRWTARSAGEAQLDLYEATRDLLNEQTRWFLRRGAAMDGDLAATIARHKAGPRRAGERAGGRAPARAARAGLRARRRRLAKAACRADLAGDIARLEVLAQAPAITEIAHAMGTPVPEAARIFFEIGERLGIDDLARRGAAIATADHYDRLAIAQALDQLAAAQAAFTREAIRAGGWEAGPASQGDRLARVARRRSTRRRARAP